MPHTPIPLEPDAADLDALTASCVAFARAHVLGLAEQPASDQPRPELVQSFREPLPESGRPVEELLGRLGPAFANSFNTAGPGYLAFIPGGGIYSAALADFLACATNRFVGVHRTAPALVEIERTVVRWLAAEMGYPTGAEGLLTTGGSLSNLIALVTARVARLPENFLDGVLYVTAQTHACVVKAARIAGFPLRAIHTIPVDDRLRMRPDALAEAIVRDRQAGLQPFFVVTSVGTTNTGAIDPTAAIADTAEREGLWLHADAAYGGFFRLVPGGDALLPGLERCDSITLDPHKGLFLPYGTGCLLVRDPSALARAHATHADYLRDVASGGDAINYADLSPELSRDFRGLRLWLPLMLHGASAFRAALAEKLLLARTAYARLAANPRFLLVDEPQLSIVAFRLRAPNGSALDEDQLNAALLERVNQRRRVFLSSTILDGKTTLRICVLSFRTHADRVEEALAALEEEARHLVG